MEKIEGGLRRQLEEDAMMGELTRPMVHEFSNYLNMILLQISVLELSGPAAPKLDLEVFRKEGRKMASLIRDWHGLIKTKPPQRQKIDLNEIIRELSDDPIIEPAVPVLFDLELAQEQMWIKGNLPEVRRLCWLLVHSSWNRNGIQPGPKRVNVQTEKKQNEVRLTVAKDGPTLVSPELEELFDAGRSVGSGLELALCKSLAFRLAARLYAENQSKGIAIHLVAAVAGP